MNYTILLYGATGYSGRMIAAELSNETRKSDDGVRVILAGRNGRALADLAHELGVDYRTFQLSTRDEVAAKLVDVDLVINAAGPFALTATRLAKAALAADCHYLDINGEFGVYQQMDDLGLSAAARKRVLLCSAGHTSAASSLLLNAALKSLAGAIPPGTEARGLGAIRLAMSQLLSLSRGSVETMWSSIREQVTVVRRGRVQDGSGTAVTRQILWHEPVGKLERTVFFADPARTDDDAVARKARIVTAVNLVDTLTAQLTVERDGFLADRIESYVEANTAARLAYQLAAFAAPIAALPVSRELARAQFSVLPDGPTEHELATEPHTIVLEIEDRFQTRIIDWHWHTPNPYVFTARVVVELAQRVMRTSLNGWLTPCDLVDKRLEDLTADSGFLRGCRLKMRAQPKPQPQSVGQSRTV
jgi:short subunit dehydrogenase-like uncharacterized protein